MIGIGFQISNAANICRNKTLEMKSFKSVKLWYDLYPVPNKYMVTARYDNVLVALSILNRINSSDILESVGDSNGWLENCSLFLQSNSQPVYRNGSMPYFTCLSVGTIYLVMKFDPLNFTGNDLLYIANDLYAGDLWIRISTFLDGSVPFWRFSVRNGDYPEYSYDTSEFPMVMHNGFVFLKIYRNPFASHIQIFDFFTGVESPCVDSNAGIFGSNYVFNLSGGNNFVYEFIFEAGQPTAESFITEYLIRKYTPLL